MRILSNKYDRDKTPARALSLGFFLVFAVAACPSLAGDKVPGSPVGGLAAMETEMDLPSSFHRYYGQRVNQWKDTERKIAKIDLDGDMNMDGVIDNQEASDQGAFEGTPPGLQIGTGEMTKLIVRVNPYRIEYDGEVVIALEISGINRGAKSGEFSSFDEEVSNTGRIRVWKDEQRTHLLLDSANPDKRYVEWATQFTRYPYNLPDILPRVVYVEGVSESKRYAGDLRILLTCSHRKPGSTPQQYAEARKSMFKSFRTTFDHILFTVLPRPLPKQYINNNVEGVWLNVGPASK
jgi:hypothetical protein